MREGGILDGMADLGDQALVVTREAGVATLWLNRPAKRNAVDYQMWLDIARLTTELGADPTVRLLVVRGSGDHFCAGGDIGGLGDIACRLVGDSTDVLVKAVPAGTMLPLRVTHVRTTNTNATNILALY